MGKSGILYLFPVPMGDSPVGDVLPARNIEIIRSVKHFIVENVRSSSLEIGRASCRERV